MRYCTNCGKELLDNARFCAYCGTAVNGETENKRKTVYEGDIHKCPNCGEVVGPFTTNCPTCGFEFRNTQATNAVKELAEKLEKIESGRSSNQSGWKKLFDTKNRISETDQEKISLIRSFAMPNSKEDLFEFMVLASSNINIQRYTEPQLLSASECAVSDAWYSRFEQSYQKAKISIGDTVEFEKINNIFTEKQKEIKKAKRRQSTSLVMALGLLIMLLLLSLAMLLGISRSSDVQKENDRLNALASEVYEAIDSREYDLAKAKTANMAYSGPNTAEGKKLTEKWEKTRNELMAVIEKAEEASKANSETSLPSNENTTAARDDNTEETVESVQVPDDFYNGYTEANFSDYNSLARENGLGGTGIYFTGTLEKTEIIEADGYKGIFGYVTDESGNTWLLQMNVLPLVEETRYDAAVGDQVCCTGVYSGFSEVKKMPVVTLNELFILKNGTRMNGMQKLLDSK